MKDNANIIVATQVTKDEETLWVCGLQKRTVWILIVLLFLVVGGIVGGVVYWLGNDDPVAPTPLDPLLQELKPWIAPTEDDLLPFDNTVSPQSLALTWLKDDPIAMSKDRDTSVVLQRYILAVLYYSTFGRGWDESYNFLSDADVCMWNNGTDSANGGRGVFCSTEKKTIDWVAMSDNNLRSGTLPWELFLLTSLTHIDLGSNLLEGTIPTRIGLSTKLEVLGLSSNRLTGPLPTTMPSTMTELFLDVNALTGTIPSSWGADMPKLEYLILNSNQLTGPLPTTMPSTMTALYLSDNALTGTIPSSWGADMPKLEYLVLNSNQLTGPLPTTMPSTMTS
jgi:hypothetical protein